MKIAETHEHIVTVLGDAGIEDAESEARIILRESAGLSSTDIHMRHDDEIDRAVSEQITDIIKRRLMREPLQYIYGRWDFMGLVFSVKPGVLIPRPDTEILVETALRELHDGMKILDLCTGTGCILISLLKYSNDCEGVGVDISQEALALAKQNAAEILGEAGAGSLTGVWPADSEAGSSRYAFLQGDLYEALDDGRFDIIVSNPPYIPARVIDTLAPEVKDYEPHLALDGGDDGLDIIRRIIDGSSDHLVRGGLLFLEIGYDQGESVSALMRGAGFTDVEVIQDYAGLDRVVSGRLPIKI
ncbi:MAG: peptide chain release factor N(5)-glutamine methyltransferase [Lachnospiraceae bacterium]|nr:peptide chain release factor N(5)-glutamine methyltransferase [Lachnospiraceae bacterium]